MFLLAVAVLTRRHDVALRGSAAPNDRHDMVHRQEVWGEPFAAIVAKARRALPLPPLAAAKLAGSSALAAKVLAVGDGDETCRRLCARLWR